MKNKKYEEINIPKNIDDIIEQGVAKAINEQKYQKNKFTKHISKVAVASFIGIITIGAVNPAIASRILFLGNIFNEIEKNLYFPGPYSQYSTSINETAYSNGIGVTLSEVLCDGESIYVTYKVESDNPLPSSSWNNEKSVNPTNQLILEEAYSTVSFDDDEIHDSGIAGIEGKFIDKFTFVGMQKYKLSNLNSEVPGEFTFKTKILAIGNYDDGKNKQEIKKGVWAFKIPVTVNSKLNNNINLNYEIDNSYTIESISITPFDTVLKGNMPIDGEIVTDKEGKEIDYEISLYNETGEKIRSVESERNSRGESVFIFDKPIEKLDNIRILVKRISRKKEMINKNSWTYRTLNEEIVLDKTINIYE